MELIGGMIIGGVLTFFVMVIFGAGDDNNDGKGISEKH